MNTIKTKIILTIICNILLLNFVFSKSPVYFTNLSDNKPSYCLVLKIPEQMIFLISSNNSQSYKIIKKIPVVTNKNEIIPGIYYIHIDTTTIEKPLINYHKIQSKSINVQNINGAKYSICKYSKANNSKNTIQYIKDFPISPASINLQSTPLIIINNETILTNIKENFTGSGVFPKNFINNIESCNIEKIQNLYCKDTSPNINYSHEYFNYSWKKLFLENISSYYSENEIFIHFDETVLSSDFIQYGRRSLLYIMQDSLWKIANDKYVLYEEEKDIKTEIENFLHSWIIAWENQEIDNYMSFYDSTFTGNNLNYNEWYQQKFLTFLQIDSIKIEYSELQITSPDTMKWNLRFLQKYKSGNYEDYGYKTLNLTRTQNNFKINSEEWKKVLPN